MATLSLKTPLLSRLTSKFQATVPDPVRKFLGLKQGDRIAFEMHKGHIVLRKATPLDVEFAAGLDTTVGEWNSKNDEEAYGDL